MLFRSVVVAVDEEAIVETTTFTQDIEDKTITTVAGTGDDTLVMEMVGAYYWVHNNEHQAFVVCLFTP